MAWEARSGLKRITLIFIRNLLCVGMAWEARSGLKLAFRRRHNAIIIGRNGLGSPFGFETLEQCVGIFEGSIRRNGLGSPFGFETY